MVTPIGSRTVHSIAALAGRLRPTSGLVWISALAGLLAAIAVAYTHRRSWLEAMLFTAITLVATALAVIDLQERRLPNSIVGPLAAAAPTTALFAGLSAGDMTQPIAAIAYGAGFVCLMAIGHMAGGFRLGDVKYSFPIGVAVGWNGSAAVLTMLLTLTVTGLLVGLLALARLRSLRARIAYGPVMSVALVAGLLA